MSVSRWHPSLRLRILAPAALVAVPAIALFVYMGFDRVRQADRAAAEQVQRLAGLKALYQEQAIDGTRRLLIAMAQSQDIRAGNVDACRVYLEGMIAQFDGVYQNLGVLDAEGNRLCTGVEIPPGNVRDRDYFKRALATPTFVVGEFLIGRYSERPALPFALAVRDPDGNVRMILYALLDLQRFNEQLGAEWPPEATLIVTDRRHSVVAIRPYAPQWIGRDLTDDPMTQATGVGHSGTFELVGSAQNTRVAAFERVDPAETGLLVRVVISKSDAGAVWSWQLFEILLAFGAVATVVLVGVHAASDRLLLQPIARLAKASRRLAAGDLGARAASSTTIPELVELAQDFDDMATALQDREADRLRAEMERKQLEQQYHQSQKMDAVGRLAGGIAHDFNNMLTAILGYCELLLDDPSVGESQRDDIREIEKAAKTAARLTRQLLGFSRREIVEPIVLDLNEVVSGMDKLLQRLLGEHISVRAGLGSALDAVKVDRAQIEQVILNLALNARDAMPEGGKLEVETANAHLPDGLASPYLPAPPGEFVRITVRDEGAGMTPDVLAHIFEPFFTTKSTGKGTGLGLATVYGIVKQSGGGLGVESEAGRGTTMSVYLPRCDGHARPSVVASRASTQRVHEKATVLIVEDDAGIRELAGKILTRCGYEVHLADGGAQAMEICRQKGLNIDVLLSDVVMPGMSGPVVASILRELRPSIKVVFMSGYTEDPVVREGVMERNVPFLQKPFTPDLLANKILEVLG